MRMRRGFTLVELLVVIGIIALLISILLPSLNRARAAGQSVKCLSNLRQMGLAFQLYENDYKGVLPPISSGNTNGGYWPNTLSDGKYLKGASFSAASAGGGSNPLFCPSGNDTNTLGAAPDTSKFSAQTQLNDLGIFSYKGATFDPPPAGLNNRNDVQSSNYGLNGLQMISGNFSTLVNGRPVVEYFPICTQATPGIKAGAGYVSPSPVKLATVKASDQLVLAFDGIYCFDRSPNYMSLRHGSKRLSPDGRYCNMVFADGHAQSVAANEMPSSTLDTLLYDTSPTSQMATRANGRWTVRMLAKPY